MDLDQRGPCLLPVSFNLTERAHHLDCVHRLRPGPDGHLVAHDVGTEASVPLRGTWAWQLLGPCLPLGV